MRNTQLRGETLLIGDVFAYTDYGSSNFSSAYEQFVVDKDIRQILK